MPNYAVVIGIDQYDDPTIPTLTNCVDGALRMATWLLKPGPAGGNVPLGNLFLLLSPNVIPATVPPDLDLVGLKKRGQPKRATAREIKTAILEAARRAEDNRDGERVYFYCASHGLQVKRSPFDVRDGFVPADYDAQAEPPLSELSIREVYKASQFVKQFFFYDFCRNQPFQIGSLANVEPQRGVNQPPPPEPPQELEQFVFFATSPAAVANDDKGLLTDSLLDGLQGVGAAKKFVMAGNVAQYELHADRLISFITQRMAAKQAAINHAGAPLQFQKPRLAGEHADSSLMTMAVLPASVVPPINLSLTVGPKDPWPIASVDVLGDGAPGINQAPIQNVPLTFTVPPRNYAVLVKAPGWSPDKGVLIQEIYEDTALAVNLVQAAPKPPPSLGMAPAPPSGPPAAAPIATPSADRRGWISIQSSDPLIPAELRDSAGKPVGGGKPTQMPGELVWSDLGPGFYLARLTAPNGSVDDQPIHLAAGQHLPVSLTVPDRQRSAAVTAVMAMADSPLPISRAPKRGPRGGSFGMREDTEHAVGIDESANSPRALLEIFVAVDETAPDAPAEPSGTPAERSARVQAALQSLAFRLWPLDGAPPSEFGRATLADTPGVATYSMPASPGAQWLEVQVGGDWPPTRFVVHVFAGLTARFVFHQEADGRIRVYQCQPVLRQDPQRDADRLRRYDLAQKYAMNGQISQGLAVAEALVATGSPRPLELSLLGYLLLRTVADDTAARLQKVAEQAVQLYPESPDAHVLAALVAAKPEDSRASLIRALDAGLPSLAPLFERLAAGIDKWKLDHQRVTMLRQVAGQLVPGLLWTAWTVPPNKTSSPQGSRETSDRVAVDTPQVLQQHPDRSFPRAFRPLHPQLIGASVMPTIDPVPVDASKFVAATAAPPPALPVTSGVCSNQPNGGPLDPSNPATTAHSTRAMADTSTLWQTGQTLQVAFINSQGAWGETIKAAVRQLAVDWSNYANIQFLFDQPQAHIVVNLAPLANVPSGTYNSYIGKQSLQVIPRGIPSMNLVFDPRLSGQPNMQSEFNRVIRHEFGHALGLIHEHMRPDRDLTWHMDRLLAQFGPLGWNEQIIREQIVNFYQGGPLKGGSFDDHSIMMYQFNSGTATFPDGTAFEAPNNTELSPQDKVLANMLYPKVVSTPLPEKELILDDPAQDGAIAIAGQVATYRVSADPSVRYLVVTEGSTPLLVSVTKSKTDPAGHMAVVDGQAENLQFQVATAGQYFVQVRHGKPMSGTGAFRIALTTAS
jgi:Caspase domain/Astacin (Peptidase family M12A)